MSLHRCPAPACTGWACEISDVVDEPRPFYGCGECGRTWRSAKALHDAIARIVLRYPYRAASYRMRGGAWMPAPPSRERADYDTLVEAEDTSPGFSVTLVASSLELVLDDGDSLCSFFARAKRGGTYLALARDGTRVHCELGSQAHGFRSRTATYRLRGRDLEVTVRSPEAFERTAKIRAVRLRLPARAELRAVRRCLAAVFAALRR